MLPLVKNGAWHRSGPMIHSGQAGAAVEQATARGGIPAGRSNSLISDAATTERHSHDTRARIAFEKERGVTSVNAKGPYAFLVVLFDLTQPRAAQELQVYRALSEQGISINLVKLHEQGLSFVVDEADFAAAPARL